MAGPEVIDKKSRIVAIKAGIITSLGNGVEKNWQAILAGEDGMQPIGESIGATYEDFVPGELGVVAGINLEEDAAAFLREHRKIIRQSHRTATLANIATVQALDGVEGVKGFRAGHYMATTFSGADHSHRLNDSTRGVGDVINDAFKYLISRADAVPSMDNELNGAGNQVGSECSGGARAQINAFGNLISSYFRGKKRPAISDFAIGGGTDAPLSPINLKIFGGSLPGALDLREDPRIVSRPNDRDAEGLIIGEAACSILYTTVAKAEEMGIKPEDIIAEVAGFASYKHAETRTLAGLEGAVRAFVETMIMAEVALGETVHLNEHATSTLSGDAREALITRLAIAYLGLDPRDFYPVSTKGATGHTMAAAGAVEALFAMLALRDDMLPPALKLNSAIPEFELPPSELELVKHLQKENQIPDYLAPYLNDSLPAIPFANLNPIQRDEHGVAIINRREIDVALSASLGFGGYVDYIAWRKFAGY